MRRGGTVPLTRAGLNLSTLDGRVDPDVDAPGTGLNRPGGSRTRTQRRTRWLMRRCFFIDVSESSVVQRSVD